MYAKPDICHDEEEESLRSTQTMCDFARSTFEGWRAAIEHPSKSPTSGPRSPDDPDLSQEHPLSLPGVERKGFKE